MESKVQSYHVFALWPCLTSLFPNWLILRSKYDLMWKSLSIFSTERHAEQFRVMILTWTQSQPRWTLIPWPLPDSCLRPVTVGPGNRHFEENPSGPCKVSAEKKTGSWAVGQENGNLFEGKEGDWPLRRIGVLPFLMESFSYPANGKFSEGMVTQPEVWNLVVSQL